MAGARPVIVVTAGERTWTAPYEQAVERADDGLIEGVESPDQRVVAVQWHLEELGDAASAALFSDLLVRGRQRQV